MSTELVEKKEDKPLSEIEQFALRAWKSGEFKGLGSPQQAMVRIQMGKELGYGPATSLRAFYSCQGVPALAANTIACQLKRSGKYNYRLISCTDEECTLEFFERWDGQKWESNGRVSYTFEEAKRAGLFRKGSGWEKNPSDMLFARALSRGARRFAPDCLGGLVAYTPEDFGASSKEMEPIGTVIDVEYETPYTPQDGFTANDSITEEQFQSIQKQATEKGWNLGNLMAHVGVDPNDPRGMTQSQREAVQRVLDNL